MSEHGHTTEKDAPVRHDPTLCVACGRRIAGDEACWLDTDEWRESRLCALCLWGPPPRERGRPMTNHPIPTRYWTDAQRADLRSRRETEACDPKEIEDE